MNIEDMVETAKCTIKNAYMSRSNEATILLSTVKNWELNKRYALMRALESYGCECRGIAESSIEHESTPVLNTYYMNFTMRQNRSNFRAFEDIVNDKSNTLLLKTQTILLQMETINELTASHNDHNDFVKTCTNMMELVVELEKDHVLSSENALHLMKETNNIVKNPDQYKKFLAEAKTYRNVADGKLSAYIMLIVGWAAKIVTFGLVGQAWIDNASKNLKLIESTEQFLSEGEKCSNVRLG